MNLPHLHLWEEAALQPSEVPPASVPGRRRPDHGTDPSPLNLRRARLSRMRLQAACLHGLFFSILLGTPLGWSYIRTTWLATDPVLAECPDLASFLPPGVQRRLQVYRSAGSLSTTDRRALGTKVCDPTLRALLQPVLGGVSDLTDLKHLADRSGVLRAKLEPLPALRAFLSDPASD